jgi:hypothetical protein
VTDLIKKIEKSKSFDKRIEILMSYIQNVDQADADKCIQLVAEKAKYPQHYAEIVACAASLPINDKEKTLVIFAQKASQHPKQAGSVAWVLNKAGYNDAAVNLWRTMVDLFADSHPNLGAQMLAYGLVLEGAHSEAQSRIAEHQSANSEVAASLYAEPKISNQVYLRHLLSPAD